MKFRALFLGAVAAALIACGSGDEDNSGLSTPTPSGKCVPGKVEPCACPGTTATGAQTCQPDGSFSACTGCPSGQAGAGGTSGQGGASGGTAGKGGSAGKGGAGGSSGKGGKGGSGGSGQSGAGGSEEGGSGGVGNAGGESGAGGSAEGGSGGSGGSGQAGEGGSGQSGSGQAGSGEAGAGGSGPAGSGGAGGAQGGAGSGQAGSGVAGTAGGGGEGGAGAGGSAGKGGGAPGDDLDKDGWTVGEGDCDDSNANINPGAVELIEVDGAGKPVLKQLDNDCDGVVAKASDSLACDAGLGPSLVDPFDAARAVGLCSVKVPDGPKGKWGVIAASLSDIAGAPLNSPVKATGASLDLSFGVLPDFGSATKVREGQRLLALSSGQARTPTQPGYVAADACKVDKNYVSAYPNGFPKDGTCGTTGEPHDGVAIDFKIRVPSNARSLRYKYRFFSCEYPLYTCSTYNDVFAVLLSPSPLQPGDPMADPTNVSANIAFEKDPVTGKKEVIGVNNESFLTACEPGANQGNYANCKPGNGQQLLGSGFEGHAGSAWLINQANVPPGGIVYMRIAIWDSTDGIFDSTTVLDAFEWSTETVDGAITVIEGTPIPGGTGGAAGAGGSGQAGDSGVFGGGGSTTAGAAGDSSAFGGSGSMAGSGGTGSSGSSGSFGPCPDGSCATAGQCCKDPATSLCGSDLFGICF